MSNDRKIVITHDGRGTMEIDKKICDALHTFTDGGAHIDKNGEKIFIEKTTGTKKIKDLGGYF